MQSNKRSQIVTQGVQRSPNRAMLRAVGFKDADFKKPIIGFQRRIQYQLMTTFKKGIVGE